METENLNEGQPAETSEEVVEAAPTEKASEGKLNHQHS